MSVNVHFLTATFVPSVCTRLSGVLFNKNKGKNCLTKSCGSGAFRGLASSLCLWRGLLYDRQRAGQLLLAPRVVPNRGTFYLLYYSQMAIVPRAWLRPKQSWSSCQVSLVGARSWQPEAGPRMDGASQLLTECLPRTLSCTHGLPLTFPSGGIAGPAQGLAMDSFLFLLNLASP